MKTKTKQIIIAVALLAFAAFTFFQLRKNKATVESNVEFAQQTVEKIPVTVEKAETGTLDQNVKLTGTLEPKESLMLLSEGQGKIVRVYKQKGDVVNKGDVIVKIDDEVIAANVLTAEANCAQFEKDVERLNRLSQENAVTKRDLEQTEIGYKKAKADLVNARKTLDNTSVKAPISGYINDDYVTMGQLLAGGAKVCEIVDNSALKLNVAVSEEQVYKIAKGQEVSVFVSVFPDKKFTGVIKSIAEKADAAMKFNVEVEITNKVQPALKSGMFSWVEIPVEHNEHILISKSAIIGSMKQAEIYVVENNKARKRTLVIGDSSDDKVEVLQGLQGTELVIVSGQQNLNDGDEITIAN